MTQVFVPIFPGTNCDRETIDWLRRNLEVTTVSDPQAVTPESLGAVVVPGGFTFGDYLRAGALAARTPAMDTVRAARRAGVPVLGICNGFQMLCEAQILPGVLTRNTCKHHLHGPVELCVNPALFDSCAAAGSVWLPPIGKARMNALLAKGRIPISCGMGAYVLPLELRTELKAGATGALSGRASFEMLSEMSWELGSEMNLSSEFAQACARYGCVPLFHYVDNRPGSSAALAAVASTDGKVVGMMPHPERASDRVLGDDCGLLLLLGLARSRSLRIRPGSPLAVFAQSVSGEEFP